MAPDPEISLLEIYPNKIVMDMQQSPTNKDTPYVLFKKYF